MLAPSGMPNGFRAARLMAVADTIEHNARAFDMQAWDCCIAGMTVLHATGSRQQDTRDFAKEYLGLNENEARSLFSPDPCQLYRSKCTSIPMHAVDARWAAAVVRRLAITGTIDWIAARKVSRAEEIRECMSATDRPQERTFRTVVRMVGPAHFPPSEDDADWMSRPVVIETELVPA